MQGFSDEEYRGISLFFDYLSKVEVQADWHQSTGYLPITDAAYYLTKKKGFYKDHPAELVLHDFLAQQFFHPLIQQFCQHF